MSKGFLFARERVLCIDSVAEASHETIVVRSQVDPDQLPEFEESHYINLVDASAGAEAMADQAPLAPRSSRPTARRSARYAKSRCPTAASSSRSRSTPAGSKRNRRSPRSSSERSTTIGWSSRSARRRSASSSAEVPPRAADPLLATNAEPFSRPAHRSAKSPRRQTTGVVPSYARARTRTCRRS